MSDSTHNVFKMTEVALLHEFKKVLTDRMVAEELQRYEVGLREKITAQIEDLTIGRLETARDLLHARDEYCLYIKWNDAPSVLLKSSGGMKGDSC